MRFIASKPELSVERAIEEIGLGVSIRDVERFIEDTVALKRDFILEKGERAVGPLMGIVMAKYRGKVDGKEINRLLKTKVQQILRGESDK